MSLAIARGRGRRWIVGAEPGPGGESHRIPASRRSQIVKSEQSLTNGESPEAKSPGEMTIYRGGTAGLAGDFASIAARRARVASRRRSLFMRAFANRALSPFCCDMTAAYVMETGPEETAVRTGSTKNAPV